ncbi:putative reverse transcriptase domain-containing protein [Tanacetum coccineum]
MRKYLEKDCVTFVKHVVDKGAKVKNIQDVLVVRNHPEVFLEDLHGLPSPRQVEFQIDIVLGAAPVVKSKEEHEQHLDTILRLLKDQKLYTKFLKSEFWFWEIAKTLIELTQKKKEFIWREEQEEAFEILKQGFCKATILALPKGTENFMVYCDASHLGLGCVLMQGNKVIAYAFRKLK